MRNLNIGEIVNGQKTSALSLTVDGELLGALPNSIFSMSLGWDVGNKKFKTPENGVLKLVKAGSPASLSKLQVVSCSELISEIKSEIKKTEKSISEMKPSVSEKWMVPKLDNLKTSLNTLIG